MVYGRGGYTMKRFLKLYRIEQKLALRSGDMLIFGVAMPVGIMILINMIAGSKQTGAGFTYLESSFASLIAVGICAAAFMGLPLTIADYRDKKILKHFFTYFAIFYIKLFSFCHIFHFFCFLFLFI